MTNPTGDALKAYETCQWTLYEPSLYLWQTDCHHLFELAQTEKPSENGMAFCCYCGKKLKEVNPHE